MKRLTIRVEFDGKTTEMVIEESNVDALRKYADIFLSHEFRGGREIDRRELARVRDAYQCAIDGRDVVVREWMGRAEKALDLALEAISASATRAAPGILKRYEELRDSWPGSQSVAS